VAAPLIVAALLAALLLPGTALAEGRPRYGGSVTGTLLGRPASLDPLRARGHAEVTVAGLVFDTLYRLTPTGAEPHLAAGPPVALADGTLRIDLLPGVRFHDGRLLAAVDVAASLERARRAAGLLAPIAAVAMAGDAIVVTLRRPCPELAALLAAPATSVTPLGEPPGARPIGSGPFAFVALDERAGELRLTAHPDHFAGRPYLDALRLRWFVAADGEARAYESGQLDLSQRGAIAFAGHQPKNPTRSLDGPPRLLVYLGFGRAHRDVLADPALRRAVHRSIHRAGLSGIGSGEVVLPSHTPLAPPLGRPTPAQLAADPAGARAALAQAVDGLGPLVGLKLELIVDASRPDDREVGEKVVAALYRLGLTATIRALAPAELAARVARGDCDLYVGHLAAPTLEPGATWLAAFAVGRDEWAAHRIAELPLDGGRMRARFLERLPIIALFHRAIRVHHRADLRGVGFDPIGRLGHADLFLVAGAAAP
jgi:peptide/nickel transport system substrate-binding protein